MDEISETIDFYELEDELDYKVLEELEAANEAEDQENGAPAEDKASIDLTADASTTACKKKDTRKQGKKSVDRPANKFSEDDAIRGMKGYIESALSLLMNDPTYSNTKYPAAKHVMSLAKQLERHVDSDIFCNFWKSTIKMLWEVIMAGNSKKLKPAADELMCQAFCKHVHSSLGRWIQLLDSLNLESHGHHVKTVNHFLQRTVLRLILNDKNKMDLPEENRTRDLPLDKHTEQVIRYVAGYVPYALVKRFKKGRSSTAKAYCEILSSWQVCSSSNTNNFLSYSKEWMEKQNRSGLFLVNDDVYLFFRHLEIETQNHFTVDKLNAMVTTNQLDVLMNKIVEKVIVQTYWCKITRATLGDAASKQLLDIVVNYWIKIRVNAFLKVYLNVKKGSGKISKKGEKSLRKELQ